MTTKSLFLVLAFSFGYFTSSAQWANTLPASVQNNILWLGDHEEGTTHDWTQDSWQYAGGGIFNTGGTEVEAIISSSMVHSGNHSIRTTITNACQAQNGSRAVRLMRWTDKAWDDGGQPFPNESYYSTWVYFSKTYNPNKYAPWDPGDGGWWNVFQFKSKDLNGDSQPVWTVNIEHNDSNGEMYFYMYTKENTPSSYVQSSPIAIPVGKWVHLEMYYKASSQFTANGEVKFWQDGQLILQANNVVTLLDEDIVWGIGNYTDHIDGPDGCGNATLYFDDCIVATEAIHPHINNNITGWASTLPTSVQNNILWLGDHEEGTTYDWTLDTWQYPGGGIFNTGGSEVEAAISSSIVHSGNYSIRNTITNACQAQNGNRAVRIMRWTDKAWDDGGQYFPEESYYSTWVYFPQTYNSRKYAPWDPGDGGWWNVFQFKSNDLGGISQPVWTANVDHNDNSGEMYFSLYSHENTPASYSQANPLPIPVGQWVHLEMYYKRSNKFTADGELKFWQDGQLILQANNVVTYLEESVTWGLGNYTDHIDGPDGCGNATVFFDDCIVATEAIHPYININNCPTPSNQTAYYVDINSLGGNCSGSNPGTICAPFCDLNIVKNKLQNGDINPGDTIYMRTGDYPSVSMYQIDGTAADPIVITNFPGESPVLDATHPNSPTSDYAFRLDRCTYFELSGLEFTNAYGQSSGGLMFNRSDHNYIHNNHIHNNRQGANQTWTSGVKLYVSSYNTIENNEIHDNNFCGTHTTSTDNNSSEFSIQNQFLNNHVYNHSGMGQHSDGIGFNSAYTSNNTVSGNLVHDCEDDGIDTWATNNNTITRNIVYNSGLGGVGDGNGYKLGGDNQGVEPGHNFIAYNISYNNVADGFNGNGSGGNEFYNNVAYNNGDAGIEDGWRASGQTDPSILRNNILMNNAVGVSLNGQYSLNSNYNLFYDSNGGPVARIDFSNYNTMASYQAANSNEVNSLNSDPKFLDLTAYDFNLQTSSPAIDAGDPSNPGTGPYIGSAPEMGVYEVERGLEINVRVLLEGAYVSGGLMQDELRQRNNLPVANPWTLTSNIPSTAYAVTGNNALVDWVLVELRAANDISTVLYTASGLLQRDGDLVDFDGVTPVTIDWQLPSSFHVVILHKSHLPVLTPVPLTVTNNQVSYDFTQTDSYTGSGFGQKQLGTNLWVAYAGDASGDRDINAQDNALWAAESGMFDVYSANDFNMNGDVSGADKILWVSNNGIYSVVP